MRLNCECRTVRRPSQTKFRRYTLQSAYHESDMLLERPSKFICTLHDILSIDRASKAFILHLLEDRTSIHLGEAAPRLDESSGYDQAAQLVTGEKRAVLQLGTLYTGICCMGQYRSDELGRPAHLK